MKKELEPIRNGVLIEGNWNLEDDNHVVFIDKLHSIRQQISSGELSTGKDRKNINPFDYEYHNLLIDILSNGYVEAGERTGTGTVKVFGRQLRFDLEKGFPLLSTKKIMTRSLIYELEWFLKGESNIGFLLDNNVHIWDEWADDKGELGPVYGVQWRNWPDYNGESIDQIANVVHSLKNKPGSRRHIVTAWNPAQVDEMALPPCHLLFQFYVEANRLSCQMYQRSADTFLGVPFNIASYALLTQVIAKTAGYEVGDFVHTFGDTHVYWNHIDQVIEQLSRHSYAPPQLELVGDMASIDDFKYSSVRINDYEHHPWIKAPISV